MPVFRYKCPKCGEVAARLVAKFDEDVHCAKCGSAAEKLPSVFAAPSASPKTRCAMAEHCASAGSHECGCGCCHHHHG